MKESPLSKQAETERALWWIINGETGMSSKTIWAAMMGVAIEVHWGAATPKDPSDFKRCRLLLDLIPEWRKRLAEMAEKYREWAPLVLCWDELDALYNEEISQSMAPRLHTMLQKLHFRKYVVNGGGH